MKSRARSDIIKAEPFCRRVSCQSSSKIRLREMFARSMRLKRLIYVEMEAELENADGVVRKKRESVCSSLEVILYIYILHLYTNNKKPGIYIRMY